MSIDIRLGIDLREVVIELFRFRIFYMRAVITQ